MVQLVMKTYSRRQISTGTKFEVSHNILVDFGQSGPSIRLVIKIISNIITMRDYFWCVP